MATDFELNIVSPANAVGSLQASAVTLPGSLGYMTILAGHAAMVSELDIGEVTVTEANSAEKHSYFLSGGFAEVVGNKVNVLADTIELASKINVDEATEQKAEAIASLAKVTRSEEIDLANRSLKEAEYRLKIANSAE